MNKFLWTMVLPCVAGCALEASGPTEVQGDEGQIGTAQSAVLLHNALLFNALDPNGILPNGILPNSLVPQALTPPSIAPDVVNALTDPGEAGDLSRMFMKYVVSCALEQGQSFDFSWADSENIIHPESFPGELGLAPEWISNPLSQDKQAWISACLASRTNYFGVPVLISMRGFLPALDTTPEERSVYTHREGAFWGNLFDAAPYLKACYNESEMAYAPSKQRVCATGYDDGTTVQECGILDSVGSCSSFCTLAAEPADGYIECEGTSQAITTFLD